MSPFLPSSIGEDFVLRARAILQSLTGWTIWRGRRATAWWGGCGSGSVPQQPPCLLPAIIGSLTRLNAGLQIRVRETITPNLLLDLAEGRLDTASVALPVSEASLTEVALFSQDFVLVRPEAEAGNPVPDRDMPREMRVLLLEEGHCFRDQAQSFCNRKTAFPRELLDGSSLTGLVQMVAAGIGVTLIPEMAVTVETHATAVSFARFGGLQPWRFIGRVRHKTSPLAKQLQQAAEVVRLSATDLQGGGRPAIGLAGVPA